MIVALSIVLLLVELWWALAFGYAFSLLRQRLLLVQAGQGLMGVLFLAMLAYNLLHGLVGISAAQLMTLLLALLLSVIWRTAGGPRLLRQRYTNHLFDVLRFRRPAVDMRRRVRTR